MLKQLEVHKRFLIFCPHTYFRISIIAFNYFLVWILYFFVIPFLLLDFFKFFSSFNISVINDSSPFIFSTCFSILIYRSGFASKVLHLHCFGILPNLPDVTKPAAKNN